MGTDPTHPVMAGMPDHAAVFVDGSPVFETQDGFKGSVLAQYQESGSPLLSGYLIGEKYLQGKAAALDVQLDTGHVVLLGFRPEWRGQPFGTFLLRQFFLTIPKELEEAARIDGMGHFQIYRRIILPLSLPALATLGAFLLLVAVARRRSIPRLIALVLIAALAGFQWYFLVSLIKLPDYAGPAQPGKQLPSFSATFADGRPFTEADLRDGSRRVITFFRGRW